MFRQVFSTTLKCTAAFGGLQLGAVAFAVSDEQTFKPLSNKELNKKPKWYIDNVAALETAVKGLSQYQYQEGEDFLHKAIDILERVENVNNLEISWRLGRAFVEEADWFGSSRQSVTKKINMLERAIHYFKNALSQEASKTCAGANKWYAIALLRLSEVDRKNKLLANANREIPYHLELSIKADPKDPYTHTALGIYHSNNKNFKEALKCCKTAEELTPHFSNVNLYYLGAALVAEGKKDEAIKVLKEGVAVEPRFKRDGRARCAIKTLLTTKLKQSKEEVDAITWQF